MGCFNAVLLLAFVQLTLSDHLQLTKIIICAIKDMEQQALNVR